MTITVTDLEAGKPDAPTVTRTRFDTETNPALDVTWTAPDANGVVITWLQSRSTASRSLTARPPAAWTAYTYTDANELSSSY